MYTVIVTPTLMPNEEWLYLCQNADALRRVVRAFNTLGVEVIDVLEGDVSMRADELAKILSA